MCSRTYNCSANLSAIHKFSRTEIVLSYLLARNWRDSSFPFKQHVEQLAQKPDKECFFVSTWRTLQAWHQEKHYTVSHHVCVLLQSYYLFSCCLLDLKTSWCSFKFHHSRQILSLCVIWEIDLPSLTRRELNSFIFIHKGFMKKLPFPLKCRTTAHQKRSQAV